MKSIVIVGVGNKRRRRRRYVAGAAGLYISFFISEPVSLYFTDQKYLQTSPLLKNTIELKVTNESRNWQCTVTLPQFIEKFTFPHLLYARGPRFSSVWPNLVKKNLG